MQTNEGFDSESHEKEATKLKEDVLDENMTGKGGHTSVNGSHFQDINLNEDDVEIDSNDKNIIKEKPKEGSKEPR